MGWTDSDEREFYELMQTYRHQPLFEQRATIDAYEAVKAFSAKREASLLARIAALEVEVADLREKLDNVEATW